MLTEKIKISSWQATALLMVNIISTAILFPPSFVSQLAGRDAWISFTLSGVIGLSIVYLVVLLCSRYPGLNLLQIGEVTLGRFLGKLVGFGFFLFFIFMTAIIVLEFSDFMATAFMPRTPLAVFNILMILFSLYAVYLGLEVICRISEAIIVPIIIFLLLIVIPLIKEVEVSSLLPLFEAGIRPVLRGSLLFSGWTAQAFLLGMLYPHLVRPQQAVKIGFYAIAFVSFYMVAGAVFLEGILGSNQVARLLYPLLSFVRLVKIGVFLERLEPVVILIWVFLQYIKISLFIYFSAFSIRQVFGLADYRTFLLPLAALAAALSLTIFGSAMELENFIKNTLSPFVLFFALGIPLFLYAVSILKKIVTAG
ncbi:MAG TPA: endospore germination permease [Firmicutes bacterium]|nr:endospore germination permease [Bacillota bacterium]